MKIANIYDKQLQAIEEAEEKVRIAKTNLLEAERELDETLELVEAESDVEHDMGEMYGVPHSVSPDYALKFFESKKRKIRESRDTIEDIVMNYSSWSGTNGINDATDSAAYDLSLVGYTFNEVKAYFDADGYYPDGCWDEEFANLILQKLRKLERNRTLESKKTS